MIPDMFATKSNFVAFDFLLKKIIKLNPGSPR